VPDCLQLLTSKSQTRFQFIRYEDFASVFQCRIIHDFVIAECYFYKL